MTRRLSTRWRAAIASMLVLVTAACGLSVVGSSAGGSTQPPGGDDAAVAPSLEASAPVRCEDVCDAGTCDGGSCVIACEGAACRGRVVCPPGVPCDVRCSGSSACLDGVDCSRASACKIDCAGLESCNNSPVVCSGSSCAVSCTGPGSCGVGMTCDAGTCDLKCAGLNTCANRPVACDSVNCKIVCGASATDGTRCAGGVTCRATGSCDVTCIADNSCSNIGVDIASKGTAQLDCLGAGACRGRKKLSAANAAVNCPGFASCTNDPVGCDGGRCAVSCGGAVGTPYDVSYCCTAETECASTQSPPCTVVRPTCR